MTYYDILQIKQNASSDEIKNAYKKLAFKWHPDKNIDNFEESEKKIKEINEAYDTLKNSDKKKLYDLQLNGMNGINGINRIPSNSFNLNPFNFNQSGINIHINNRTFRNNFTVSSSSIQTSFVNGKKITKKTTTTVHNGVKTITEEIIE